MDVHKQHQLGFGVRKPDHRLSSLKLRALRPSLEPWTDRSALPVDTALSMVLGTSIIGSRVRRPWHVRSSLPQKPIDIELIPAM
jgi:hypothetical protein